MKIMHQFFSLLTTIRDRFGHACFFYVCEPRIDFEKNTDFRTAVATRFFLFFHCNVFLKPARLMRVLFLLPPSKKSVAAGRMERTI